jgi:ankyrin repeat protein
LIGPQKDIFSAAANGDLKFCKEEIEGKGVSVDIVDHNGNTPLHWAAYNKQRHVVQFLLSKGSH